MRLVTLECWNYCGWLYSVYIRWDGSQFIYEGKKRIKYSRHTYFPDADRQFFLFDHKNKCIEFLNLHLTYQFIGCPDEILIKLTDQLKRWSDK